MVLENPFADHENKFLQLLNLPLQCEYLGVDVLFNVGL